MAYSDSFPAIRPSFQFSADAGRLDSRISYSRSTTGTYFGKDKHLSSHNLAAHNNNLPSFSNERVDITAGQTSPSGASDAFKVAQKSGITSSGYVGLNPVSVVSGQRYVFSMYAKAGTNRNFVRIADNVSGSTTKVSYFNLSTGATGTVHADHNATITAVGSSGWHRVSIEFTPDANRTSYVLAYVTETDGSATVTDDQGFIYMYGLQFEERDSGGPTVYNATSGQIHREYAPTLQTAAINAPRFEFSASDSASEVMGQSRGLLIEGSSTQLLTYSSDMSNVAWAKNNVTASVEAIGPDGSLSAVAVREGTATGHHHIRQSVTLNGNAATFSVYAKILGNARRLVIREDAASGSCAVFDLTTGTVASEVAGGTGTITSVGNGWYRCTMLCAPPAGSRLCSFWVVSNTATNYETITGDGYSGLLLAMPQAEQQSFSSSWISSTSSTVTRAADSASMPVSSTGYTGGPITLVGECDNNGSLQNRALMQLFNGDNDKVDLYGNSSNARACYVGAAGVGSSLYFATAENGKRALRIDTDNLGASLNGASVITDTSQALPDLAAGTLYIGDDNNGSNSLNGHIKRLALYGEALSDTNLQAITS